MAKSVGTLKAMLVLDSKGFLGGFDKAARATQTGMDRIGRTAGTTAARSFVRWSAAVAATRMALRGLSKEIGLLRQTDPAVNAAAVAAERLGTTLRTGLIDPLLSSAAPAFTFVFESALDGINQVGASLDQLGIGFDDVGRIAMLWGGLVGNSFKLAAETIEIWAATIQGAMASLGKLGFAGPAGMLGASAAAQSAQSRQQDAMERWLNALAELRKIASGDLSGVIPKRGRVPFMPKATSGLRSNDLDFPALEIGTNDAMKRILAIQRPDAVKDHQKKVEQHLEAIDKNTKPKRGGDAILVGKLGGR